MKKFFSFLAVGVLSSMISIVLIAIYQCEMNRVHLDELIPSSSLFTRSAKKGRGI